MDILEATETKCCCNCKHDIRIRNILYLENYCAFDDHYISYKSCFNERCDNWEKELEHKRRRNEQIDRR